MFVIDGGTGHVLGGKEGPIPEYTGPAQAAPNERTDSINNYCPIQLCLVACLSLVLVIVLAHYMLFPYYIQAARKPPSCKTYFIHIIIMILHIFTLFVIKSMLIK